LNHSNFKFDLILNHSNFKVDLTLNHSNFMQVSSGVARGERQVGPHQHIFCSNLKPRFKPKLRPKYA